MEKPDLVTIFSFSKTWNFAQHFATPRICLYLFKVKLREFDTREDERKLYFNERCTTYTGGRECVLKYTLREANKVDSAEQIMRL